MCLLLTVRMKLCVLLVCQCVLWWRTEADSRSYLVAAPLSLHLDATETVLLQLFGFTDPVRVYVFLRTSLAPGHVVLDQADVTLDAQNNHQAVARLRLFPSKVDKTLTQVVLHVQSQEINHHVSVPISRDNGFLFIQTDKPLYTPHQGVNVRAFSLNQELRPAKRSVLLTFKDPDRTTVDVVKIVDVDNGIPTMRNPFRIPAKPKLGLWTIEASYADDFTTKAKTDFEVKEYVLPSFSIHVQPQTNYISSGQFERFLFKVSASYNNGAPVARATVILRYGYISGKNPPVIIPSSITWERLSNEGELDVVLNMQRVLSRHDGPQDLGGLVRKYLYIAVLVKEDTGGISQEAEFASVMFVNSPYTLRLVSTSPFIKPGLPYNIQVLVKDHLDKPVSQVPVVLAEQQSFKQGMDGEDFEGPNGATSDSNGIAVFICNTPAEVTKVVLKFVTADTNLLPASQAELTLTAVAYESPNQRYIYIDPPQPNSALQVGSYANIKVYSAMPSYVPISALSYMVLSKGKVVHFGTQKFLSGHDNLQTLNFRVTPAMAPSVRLLVYYITYSEATSELVADAVWLDVRAKCVNGLQTELSYRGRSHKPQDELQLDIQTNEDGLVALAAADSAVFTVRANYRNPLNMVLRRIEDSDLGCGGGGGRNNADVFRLAGLTFMTNANAQASSGTEPCTAVVRPKRALTEAQKQEKALTYGPLRGCCLTGMRYIPKSVTCQKFAEQTYRKHHRCRQVFRACCEYVLEHLSLDQNLILGRHELGADFNQIPILVRSAFPESWMWHVHSVRSGRTSITKALKDSLTTWQIQAVGMLQSGICVADPVEVSVSLPVSLDVPLPYQVVRGEQLQLRGSVYNRLENSIKYCVTLTVGPEICLLNSLPDASAEGLRSTECNMESLFAGGVSEVQFIVLALEPGEHTLTFKVQTRKGHGDIVVKKLRVVPEGARKEVFAGGRLDPHGIYGLEKLEVDLRNRLPPNIIPDTPVERELSISGEIIGNYIEAVLKPDGIRQLINLPLGSAGAEVGAILTQVQVYNYLETTSSWGILGHKVQENAANLRQRIQDGLISLSSFRNGDSSYSMWMKREPCTWLTALVVKALAVADPISKPVFVDHQALSDSVAWLMSRAQQADGSFVDPSSYRPNKLVAGDGVEYKVYLTSFVLIALRKASTIDDPILQLRSHDVSMNSAANYITEHADALKTVYVRAVANYALTLHNSHSMTASQQSLISSLEKTSREMGQPVVLRYWQEANVAGEWVKPDQSSGVTVETTAYVMLAALLKGRLYYTKPIMTWLTQDQHYGEGFYSVQDTVLTLEATTEYAKIIPRAVLDQWINLDYARKGPLGRFHLNKTLPVVSVKVTQSHPVTVSTGYGTGVSIVKLRTVYYETQSDSESCHFDVTVEVTRENSDPSMRSPHLTACAKYKPPPNEVMLESGLTVMKIELPTAVEPFLEDLLQFRDADEPTISHFELDGNTVVIQMDAVPSDIFLCVGFRIRTKFVVSGITEAQLSVYEPQDKGSMCTKRFSYQDQKLQRLCVGNECQCMAAACAAYRGNIDASLTIQRRTVETCQPQIKYAYKVNVVSSAAEGDFMTYVATIVEVLKNTDTGFAAVRAGTRVELLKKATCGTVSVQNNRQYLVMGASGTEVIVNRSFRYRLPLDSDALVELWPTECSTSECVNYLADLDEYALDMQLSGCRGSS